MFKKQIHLPYDLYEDLCKQAKKHGLNTSAYMVMLLKIEVEKRKEKK